MKKSNVMFKSINSVSPGLTKSRTSKADPQIYNGRYCKSWEVDNGLVNTAKYAVNKCRWEKGFPANIDNA